MKILVQSKGRKPFKAEVEVHNLVYDAQDRELQVPYAEYDWFTEFRYARSSDLLSISLIYNEGRLLFPTPEGAEHFIEWLKEADQKARVSFSKMPG